jgi:pimeloyl-ACP methyl ester carboxylesterase
MVAMRFRVAIVAVVAALLAATAVVVVATRDEPPPVIFVHGMSGDAREVGAPGGSFDTLLPALAERYPSPDACSPAAQPARAWAGSPCVFRYVDDVATGGRSQSGVEANADKLATEVAEMVGRTDEPVVLMGFSMGGAIVRAYLSLHPVEAAENVRGAVILHGAVSGSWLLAGEDAATRFADPFPAEVLEILGRLADDVEPSPAVADLTPGSPLMRRLAERPPPASIAYTTVWGDIRVTLDLPGPDVELPSLGDIVLLPGDRDPGEVPELGGQRFAPGPSAVEIRHGDRLTLGLADLTDLTLACALPLDPGCRSSVQRALRSPSAHWRIPSSLDDISIERSPLGAGTLEELVIEAVGRPEPA